MADAGQKSGSGEGDIKVVAPGTVVVPGSGQPLPIAPNAPAPTKLPEAQPPKPPPQPQPQPAPKPAPQPPKPQPASPPPPPPKPAPPKPAPIPIPPAPVAVAPAPQPAPRPQPAPAPQQRVAQVQASLDNDPDSVTWTASEFLAHDKTAEWYVLLAAGTAAAAGLMYLIVGDLVSVSVIIVAALVFGFYGSHKPRQLGYRVDRHGLTIGTKTYAYEEFKSFSVEPEGAFSSIVLMPLGRFAVPITVFYAPEDEDRIIGILGDYVPYEQRRRDAVDNLMRKVHF
jgi:hypothetical protein